MAPRSLGIAIPLLALAAAGLLAASGPASAMYVMTPLRLGFSDTEVQAGDEVTLVLDPEPEDENATKYAGQTVRVRYSWDSHEGEEGLGAPPEDGTVAGDVGTLALDAKVHGSITWTLPAEADGHNVFFQVLGADDKLLAAGHVPVGDAPPVMAAMGGGPGGAPLEAAPEDESTGGEDEKNAVPAPGLLALAAGVGALALLRRRA